MALRNQIGNQCLRNAPYSEFKIVKTKEFELVIKDFFSYMKSKISSQKKMDKKKDKKREKDGLMKEEAVVERTYDISYQRTLENQRKFKPANHVMWLKVCLHTWKEYLMITADMLICTTRPIRWPFKASSSRRRRS